MMTMTHLDLCSGIGGFALAAQWAGYRTIGFCEIDPWCRRVIAKNFPGVPMHDDLKTLEGHRVRQWVAEAEQGVRNEGAIVADAPTMQRTPQQRHQPDRDDDESRTSGLDLITGGYPCQPFSLAGKRLGAEDDRHLWPTIARLVAELRPATCLFENVAGHITLGLDAVLSDLEALGYACRPVVVPACAVGAPHRRDRVWILADTERDRSDSGINPEREHPDHPYSDGQFAETLQLWGGFRAGVSAGGSDVPNPHEQRSDGTGPYRAGRAESADGNRHVADSDDAGREEQRERVAGGEELAASECHRGREALSGMDSETHGLSGQLLGRPATRPAGWHPGPDVIDPWGGDWEAGMPRTTTHEHDRTHKLKALGNAILPQVAYELLRALGGR